MRSYWQWGLAALVVIGLMSLPGLSFGTKDNLTLLVTLFTIASLASSWNLLAGYVGHINLGHVAFFGLGSMVTRILWLQEAWPFALAFLAGAGAAAIAALVVGAPALRLKGIYFAIGTLALAEALRLTVGNVLARVSRLPGPMLRTYDIVPRYYLSLGVLIIIVAIVYLLTRSRLGLGMMAVREDEDAARSIGINTFAHSLAAFVLSAFLAGLAGGTFAFFHVAYYHNLAFSPVWTFDALIVTFVGGVGTLVGPLVGALFFVLVRDILAGELVNLHLIIFGAIFIFTVLVLPGGFAEVSERVQRAIAARQTAKAET